MKLGARSGKEVSIFETAQNNRLIYEVQHIPKSWT